MASKWSQADKISAAAMVIALVALIGPFVGHRINVLHEPHATIDRATTTEGSCNPSLGANGGEDRPSIFSAKGTASNIPVGEDLWLAARTEEGLWYPLTRIDISSEPWSEQQEINVAKGTRIAGIYVIMLTAAEDGQLIRYMKNLHTNQQHVDPNLSSLPPGSYTFKNPYLFPRSPWGSGILLPPCN